MFQGWYIINIQHVQKRVHFNKYSVRRAYLVIQSGQRLSNCSNELDIFNQSMSTNKTVERNLLKCITKYTKYIWTIWVLSIPERYFRNYTGWKRNCFHTNRKWINKIRQLCVFSLYVFNFFSAAILRDRDVYQDLVFVSTMLTAAW